MKKIVLLLCFGLWGRIVQGNGEIVYTIGAKSCEKVEITFCVETLDVNGHTTYSNCTGHFTLVKTETLRKYIQKLATKFGISFNNYRLDHLRCIDFRCPTVKISQELYNEIARIISEQKKLFYDIEVKQFERIGWVNTKTRFLTGAWCLGAFFMLVGLVLLIYEKMGIWSTYSIQEQRTLFYIDRGSLTAGSLCFFLGIVLCIFNGGCSDYELEKIDLEAAQECDNVLSNMDSVVENLFRFFKEKLFAEAQEDLVFDAGL